MSEDDQLNSGLRQEFEQQFKDQLVRGSQLLNSGKHKEALPLLERAHQLKPKHYEAALNLGGAYIMAGRFKQAVPILESAAELHPDEPQLWVNLGAAYLGNPVLATEDKQQKALAAFNRALLLNPFAPNVEYNIGLIHRDRGEIDLAIHAFKRALSTNPDDDDARHLIERLSNAR